MGDTVFVLVLDFHDGSNTTIIRTKFGAIKQALAAHIFTNRDDAVTDQVSSESTIVRRWLIRRATDTDVVAAP